MGFDVFHLEIQSQQPVYFSGQQLAGFLRIFVSSEVSCTDIAVISRGKAEVRWTEHRNKRTHTYTNEEKYGIQEANVWKGSEHDNKLQPGNYVFPFVFVLPNGLPSSFESDHGKINYQLKAVAYRSWSFNKTTKVPYYFHNLYDLNVDGSSRYPMRIHAEETPGCSCFSAGLITFDLSANRTGYVPGEKILISGKIINHTNSTIKYTEAKLVQTIDLQSTIKSRGECEVLQRVYRPQINTGGVDVWSNVPLTIPAVTPTGLEHCNIINVNYELMFVAKIGCCKSAKANTKLIIGSVPFVETAISNVDPIRNRPMMESQPVEQNPVYPSHLPSAPQPPQASYYAVNDPAPPYPESEPPTYEESNMQMALHKDDEGGFVPIGYGHGQSYKI